MKKAIGGGLAGFLALAGLALWALSDQISWSVKSLVISGLTLALVSLTVFS
jgi:hypothetical protein